MSEQTNVGSGPTPSAPDAGAATPTAPAAPQTNDQLWEKLESDAAQGQQAAPAPETPEPTADDFVYPGEEPAATPEVEEPAEEATPEEPVTEAEPEKTPEDEAKEDADKWLEYTPIGKLTAEQKAFFNANPQLRQTLAAAVRRDREYHDAGIPVQIGRAHV